MHFRVHHKIGDSHFAARNQRRKARKQTKGDQKSANEFNRTADHAHRVERSGMCSRRETKKLLSAVTRKPDRLPWSAWALFSVSLRFPCRPLPLFPRSRP